ncbi:hypothetical protein SSTU70S_05421 [Stutzerimonas stutzeri]
MHPTSSPPGTLQLHSAARPAHLRIAGDWTLAHYNALRDAVVRMRPQLDEHSTVELRRAGRTGYRRRRPAGRSCSARSASPP